MNIERVKKIISEKFPRCVENHVVNVDYTNCDDYPYMVRIKSVCDHLEVHFLDTRIVDWYHFDDFINILEGRRNAAPLNAYGEHLKRVEDFLARLEVLRLLPLPIYEAVAEHYSEDTSMGIFLGLLGNCVVAAAISIGVANLNGD